MSLRRKVPHEAVLTCQRVTRQSVIASATGPKPAASDTWDRFILQPPSGIVKISENEESEGYKRYGAVFRGRCWSWGDGGRGHTDAVWR